MYGSTIRVPPGLPFRPWAYAAMLSWLSENRVPLWIPVPDADADELVTTLQAFPDLVTVLVGGAITATRCGFARCSRRCRTHIWN